MERYIPTGNESISLPKINEQTAGIEDFTFLSMQYKGMIKVCGDNSTPLIQPFIKINNKEVSLTNLRWKRDHYWIPELVADIDNHYFTMTILTPIRERGFAIRLSLSPNNSVHNIETFTWGLRGCWDSSWHCVNEDKKLEGSMHCYESNWNNSLIFDFRSGSPVFSFAPMCNKEANATYHIENEQVHYSLSCEEAINNEPIEIIFYWGLGFEEVAAATSAKEMLRRGWSWEYKKTIMWLDKRTSSMPTPKLTQIYNTNLFFCFFYSTGITLDTEELVCATSRSTRYYVSAAYWDRDVLLWAFPAILDADCDYAKEILHYIFGRQRKNLGIHSRYIDGTVLEPGFELDELLSPIIALESYVDKSNDTTILENANVKEGIHQILKTLSSMRHPKIYLYETFLQPTDDEIVYPYLTYNNILVWRSFTALAKLYPNQYSALTAEADEVKKAIYEHCVFFDNTRRPYFAWSVDLLGEHNIYDEPPGSLQLLPYYGFCNDKDAIWKNTVSMIRSPEYKYSFANDAIAEIGCAHAPFPWVLSLCNSLLCGYTEQAFSELEIMEMDNGVACESVDPNLGTCTTGAAFATCAGFLCHSIKYATKED